MTRTVCLAIPIAALLLMLGQPRVAIYGRERTRVQNFAEVNGTRLSYEIAGQGPAVILIHGGLVDSRLWDDQMNDFSKQCRVVRYDLRGFGKSAEASEPFSHIEDLRALLDFLKIERATIVGLSLGGIIAADFALEYPERVDRLVLVGSGLRGDKQPPARDAKVAWEAAQRGSEPFVEFTMRSDLYSGVHPGTVVYTRLRQMLLDNFKAVSTFRPGFLKYPEPPTIERLGSINAPTLVVIGSRDARNLKNIAHLLTKEIHGARMVVINGASHHPPVEKPKQFNKIVLNFIVAKSSLIPVVNQQSFAAHAIAAHVTNEAATQSVDVTDALKASFGSAVEAVSAFRPFYVTGDFNGDAVQDIVIAVRIKERRTALPKDVQVLNPFYGSPKVTYPSNPASENKMALAIIHSWKSPQPAAKFLLIGEGPILIFVYDRTSDPDGAKDLMGLMSKRGKRRRGDYFPPTAKGDVILLGTEVGSESPLYWNGKTYRWEELEGD